MLSCKQNHNHVQYIFGSIIKLTTRNKLKSNLNATNTKLILVISWYIKKLFARGNVNITKRIRENYYKPWFF